VKKIFGERRLIVCAHGVLRRMSGTYSKHDSPGV